MPTRPPLILRWIHALKLPGWPKVLVPALFGQGLAFTYAGHIDWGIFGTSVLYTLFLTAWIVLLNDWADREIDGIKRHVFPLRGSAKTLYDGLLSPRALLVGAGCAGLCAAATGLLGHPLYRPFFPPLAVVLLVFLPLYSLPPFRLNYRGGGELLEAAGVGFILPAAQFLFQANAPLLPGATLMLLAYTLLALGSALASGMADEGSDRIGGKRTLATAVGTRITAYAAIVCYLTSLPLWVLGAFSGDVFETLPPAIRFLPVAGLLLGGVLLAQATPTGPADRSGITRFKQRYHRFQWSMGLLWTALFTYEGLFAA